MDQIVTKQTLKRLPVKAQIAFAAHCVSQVLPLLSQCWRGATEDHVDSIQESIDLATSFTECLEKNVGRKAQAMAKWHSQSARADLNTDDAEQDAAIAAMKRKSYEIAAAMEVARSANFLSKAVGALNRPGTKPVEATENVVRAIEAARLAAGGRLGDFDGRIKRSFESLVEAATREKWKPDHIMEHGFFVGS